MLTIFDTGPLYAALDRDDDAHEACAELLTRGELRPVIPALVVAEVGYLAGTRLGADVEATFLAALADFDVEPPLQQDYERIAKLVRKHADFPLGTVDASIVALAERLQVTHVATLDHRHFHAVRPRHCDTLTLLPAH
jgi:predicted nucleic acid-binding protein